MAHEIIWTKRSLIRFNLIIDYLQSEWGHLATQNFINKSYHILDLISLYPELGSIENQEKNIRGFLITKHNRLFYRVEGNRIILLNFFDTRSGPERPNY
ncbi:MAG: type II toxin-antitoxin system RelE/ParE family toxin [Bacteroidetes bacterium]|nr:type II toxin-antitoxin system RelE/ParE family toxin [Bacteroidota bacterium]MBS1540010.1 type II toxin-antitoxin system RelE/ParE family toxin [Bacteroidota bacterium]